MALSTCLGKLANGLRGTLLSPIHSLIFIEHLLYFDDHCCCAAELAATRREAKCVELSATHHIVPPAFKSLDPIGSKVTKFLKELCRRLTLATNNPWETISVPTSVCSVATF